ncbi:membrane metallo-endopeptidase-like 1 isoform X2 [Mercenaria mercenaria]|uniref:membrane metallo-endopeptidase-like 1 isoform X2 n=1 Tax=Mercenaria mercenaria TaxID=6596 RepID=UPI00234E3DDC|nr:membrane metallo-endopeptidase-like 1 isoform X2 [Mercenaria mercenaria]
MDKDKAEALTLRTIHQYTEAFGGWPVLGSNDGGKWDPNRYNLENLLVHSKQRGTSMPLIEVGVVNDILNPTKYILYIDQASLGMPSREYYLKDRYDKILMAYQTLLEESYVAFGADPTTAENDAKDVVDMEIEVANITLPSELRRDVTKWKNKKTIGELGDKFPGVDWKKLITGTMKIIGMSINDSEPVVAVSPSFLQKIGNVISKYPSRVIANYIIGSVVMDGKVIFYLPQIFKDIQHRYQQVLSGTTQESARWQKCSNNVKLVFPEAVGRLFVEEKFRTGAKENVLELVDNLKKAFKGMVDELTWMEDSTKQLAKEKADVMEAMIGYPDLLFNDSALHSKYENVTVYIDDPLRTIINAGEAAVIRGLQKLRKVVDKTEWMSSAADVNAFNLIFRNQILFPAAILQPPYYSYEQPEYLNYGGIGYVIGHEICHGFDDQGRNFNKYAGMINWWSDNDSAKYKDRAQCIIDQYDNFTVPGTDGTKLNGRLTIGENIADNGGIKESFKAYREWLKTNRHGKEEQKLPGLNYTPNQLLYLNAAQVWCDETRKEEKLKRIYTDSHSYQMFRVIGPLQNSEEFSIAWNCPAGSYKNPPNKCTVW